MAFLARIFSTTSAATAQFSAEAILAESDKFHALLTGGTNPAIRLWVEENSNLGNQSSTINLLYRLVRPRTADKLTYGYAGTIEVYYQTAETLEKIYQLLPELAGRTSGRIDAATVTLTQWTAPPAARVRLAFTGAADDPQTSRGGLAAMLNVETFLRLQPYLWKPQRQQIVFQDTNRNIDLNAQPELGDAAFGRRLYNVDKSLYQAPDFSLYPGPIPEIVRYLTGDDFLATHALQAIYSFKDSLVYFNQSGIFATALCCGAALRWQGLPTEKPYKNRKPVVIVNFDNFAAADSVAAVARIVEGGATPEESRMPGAFADATVRENIERRKAYFTSLGAVANARFSTLFNPATLLQVQHAVAQISGRPDRVLFLQLGNAPQPLFNYALYRSTLVPVFEGQNATNAAINMGRAYMQIPRESATVEERAALYPSAALQGVNPSAVTQALVNVAGQYNTAPTVWPTSDADAPCTRLALYNREYVDSRTDPRAGIYVYFRALNQQYAQAQHDKFNIALAFWNTKVLSAGPLSRRNGSALALAEPKPLEVLYARLQGQVKIGEPLDLIPGILTSGTIRGYVLAVLSHYAPSLTLTVASFTHDGDPGALTRIELTGTTSAFAALGVENGVTIAFTAPGDTLLAEIRFTALGPWTMPGVDWIALRDPFLELRVPDGGLPVGATIGGYYPPLERSAPPLVACFAIPLYTSDPVWPATIAFDETYPGIATAFQMATSVNLVSLLPPPLSAVADFGVVRVETLYDFENTTLQSLLLQARSNTKGLPLVGNVTLQDLEMTALLVDPAGTADLSVSASGAFAIGPTGTLRLSVEYPNWQFLGRLEGTVTLSEMLAAFLPFVVLEPPSEPQITDFRFAYAKATDSLSVSMQFNLDWSFSFPGKQNLFEVRDVGFSISRNRGANAGSLTGSIVLFGGPAAVALGLSAAYDGTAKGWTFRAVQTSGVFDVGQIVHYYLGESFPVPSAIPHVKDLSVTFGTASGTYEISAATAAPWQPIDGLDVSAANVKLKVGYGIPPKRVRAASNGALALGASNGALALGSVTRATGPAPPPPELGYYGELSGDLQLWNIALSVALKFDPAKYEVAVVWGPLVAVVTKAAGGDTVARFTLAQRSIGSLVEEFVSWVTGSPYGLAAPFNILNEVTLSNFEVVYNFTKESVSFDVRIGPVDLGLFTLQSVGLVYNPKAAGTKEDPKTKITVDAKFAWDSSSEPLSWDPSKPESTPAPSGGGNKYVDLRLLALGQHVTVAGLAEQRRVQDAIALLRKLEQPEPPQIPVGGKGQPVFAPDSSWFVAMDFGLLKVGTDKKNGTAALAKVRPAPLATFAEPASPAAFAEPAPLAAFAEPVPPDAYFIQLSIVFNDPQLYALRIALAGPLAKVFDGLDFQIVYRQVSETVGVYSAEIVLPALMRRIQTGAFTIGLPTFALDVYTNGDFEADIGFPWNQSFARSFTVEAIVPPGIPVTGAAGFYFGKLSSLTASNVPKTSLGWFNPVLVFGFGAQLGLGKSLEAGILRAGFSATVFGVIEGVLARWLPYDGGAPNQNKGDLQNGYFFALTGVVGAIGKLYGSIDFAIVKADVNVEIRVMIQIRLASYEPIPISLQASVEVSVTLSINLGLFSIDISFSFAATIKATFTLDNPMKNPPWGDALEAQRTMLRRLRALSAPRTAPYVPVWSRLLPGTKLELDGYVAPVLTVAGDTAATPDAQQICYVASFFLKTPPPVERTAQPRMAAASSGPQRPRTPGEIAHAALQRANRRRDVLLAAGAANVPKASFEDFAVRVLQWVLAAGQPGDETVGSVENLVVSVDELDAILRYLSDPANPNPIPVDAIQAFLSAQVAVAFDAPSAQGAGDGVFFPAPPSTRLIVPDYGAWKGIEYTFGAYNRTTEQFRARLAAYFAKLRIDVQPPSVDDPPAAQARLAAERAAGESFSVASYLFADYFTGIARQGVQSLLASLRNFKRAIDPDETIQQIVDRVNERGRLAGTGHEFTKAFLFEGNPEHRLVEKARLTISRMAYRTAGGASFDDIAKLPLFGSAFDGTALATANAQDGRILQPGVPVVAGEPKHVVHVVQGGDSLQGIADRLKLSLSELLATSNVLSEPALLTPLALLLVPDFAHVVAAAETPASVAAAYGLSAAELAAPNGAVANLFDRAADPNLNITHLVQYRLGDMLDELHRTLALQNLGGMMSRFYLHGLRIPTAEVQAAHRGLFVTERGSGDFSLPPVLGLFALSGQAFALPLDITLPVKPEEKAFAFTLARGADETWLSFGADTSASLTWKLVHQADFDRYTAVRDYARAHALDLQTTALAPLAASDVAPSRFPLGQETVWQTPVRVVLPRQPLAVEVQRPRLWMLPPALVDLPHGASDATLPRFTPLLSRYDQATGATATTPVRNYGTGTLVAFKVKKVPPVSSSPTTAHTYQIIGAATGDIVLLERLLDQLRNDDAAFQQMLLLYPPGGAGAAQQGWESADPATTAVGIAQVNLSTETRPPIRREARAGLEAPKLGHVINGPTAFLRLLWEATITRQGGFFLAYHDAAHDAGLPDAIFNDRGEATVAVLALYGASPTADQTFTNYVNVIATDEAFALGDAAFVLEAVRVPLASRATFQSDALGALAQLYYLDPATLIERNPAATFAQGAKVAVEGGLYQVRAVAKPTLQQPGGDVALIAQHFGITVEALKAANPYRRDWPVAPNVLPPFVGLALPPLVHAVTDDATSFADLAAFYGTSVAALAAASANADVSGLLAPGQTLAIELGPVERSASVPPGVAGLQLVRTAPDPQAADGVAYLRRIFSLLGYHVAGCPDFDNPEFLPSNLGLPASPIDPAAAPAFDKIAAPRAAAELSDWTYRVTIPYPRFWAHPPSGTDPSAPSPYLGVGGLLQIGLDWRDIFGNLALTELGNPAAAQPNYAPQIPGYTDDIIGLAQWPSISSAYRLRPDEAQQPLLELVLDFDPSPYLADATAQDDTPRRRRIRTAIRLYATVLQQLQDPSGVEIELTTTIAPGAGSILDRAAAAALVGWLESLATWLESLLSPAATAPPLVQVHTISVPLALGAINPGEIFEVAVDVTIRRKAQLVCGALRSAAAVRARTASVAPYTGPLSSLDAESPPTRAWLAAASREASGPPSDTLRDLALFAASFTQALAKLAPRSFRIATGGDRASAGATIWAVQLGLDAATAIAYRIDAPGAPLVFAPQPLSNKLSSSPRIPIYDYTSGKGIDFGTPARFASFEGIDLDAWMRQALASIDALLTPQYVTPMLVVQQRTKSDVRAALLAAKSALANALKDKLIAVYAGEHTDEKQNREIREVFLQRMLDTLGNFYTIKAGLQFAATVHAAVERGTFEEQPPRLYGDVAALAVPARAREDGADRNYSITSPKLDLAFANEPGPQKRLLSALFASTSAQSRSVGLNLEYQGRFVEHQIGSLDGILDYHPSSWLTFVDDRSPKGGPWPLTQPLGAFDVPIVLREFPPTPTLVLQTAVAEPSSAAVPPGAYAAPPGAYTVPIAGPCNPLSDVKRWTYGFTYAQAIHQQQDTIYGTIAFNVKKPVAARLFAEPRTLFADLAEFVTVYPAVLDDLNTKLAALTFATDDPAQIGAAVVAVTSATALVQRLSETAGLAPVLEREFAAYASAAVPPFAFTLVEGALDDGRFVLTLTATTWPVPGVGVPYVDIESYHREPAPPAKPPAPDNVFRYVYKARDGSGYLTASEGARIPERLFRLPGLDVLQRQDAETAIHLTRNEELVPGHRSADAFIYTTPSVRFPDPLLPALSSDAAIDVATIATPNCDPLKRPLHAHLTALYDALFANAGVPDSMVQLVVHYDHTLNPALPPVSLPVCMMPPVKVALLDGGQGHTIAELVAEQVAALDAWFAAHEPSGKDGTYRFELTVMSGLTVQPMPILRLTGLYLPVAAIVPAVEPVMVSV